MEKAILKTLIYADIFDYPLNLFEIHKWLIGEKVELYKVEKVVEKLNQKSIPRLRSGQEIKNQNGYYFLPKRDGILGKRKRREKQSEIYLRKAKILAFMLKVIPWIKLVGVSGGLAMGNASKSDDIDFFIITSKNRLWLSRLLILTLLTLVGQRRKVTDRGKDIAGKICLNTLVEEDKLEQISKDIYTAHEVLQMKVFWERDGIYSKYLSDNGWVFKFLPNWVGNGDTSLRGMYQYGASRGNLQRNTRIASSLSLLAMTMEKMAKWIQLKIMRKPKGMERIQDGALYFHPLDYRLIVLKEYNKRISRLNFGTP